MALVYSHTRIDTNEIFYIGLELDSINKKSIGRRPKIKQGKSEWWKRIVNKTDYIITIIKDNLSNDEAIQLEIDLIKLYGRADRNLGPLVNHTDGGEGIVGFKHSDKTILKMSNTAQGRKMSDEIKLKLSNIKKGKRNLACEKKVINTETNEIYDSVKILAKLLKIHKSTLANKLNGHRKNNTIYQYYKI